MYTLYRCMSVCAVCAVCAVSRDKRRGTGRVCCITLYIPKCTEIHQLFLQQLVQRISRAKSQRTRLAHCDVTRVSRHSRGRPVTGCVTSYLGEQLSTGWLTLSSDVLRFGPFRSSQRTAPQRCWQTHPAFCRFTRSAHSTRAGLHGRCRMQADQPCERQRKI